MRWQSISDVYRRDRICPHFTPHKYSTGVKADHANLRHGSTLVFRLTVSIGCINLVLAAPFCIAAALVTFGPLRCAATTYRWTRNGAPRASSPFAFQTEM